MKLIILTLIFCYQIIKISGNIIDFAKNKTILCFGDSLTHGMYVTEDEEWRHNHPYSIRLQELIPSSSIVEKGVIGDDTQKMINRLPQVLQETNPSVVILLAGSGDIRMKFTPLHVFDNIMDMHRMIRKAAKTADKTIISVAVTIPPAAWHDEEAERYRKNVNRLIRVYVSRHSDRMILFDLAENPKFSVIAKYSKFWSADRIHFSPEGYDSVADAIFYTLSNEDITSG